MSLEMRREQSAGSWELREMTLRVGPDIGGRLGPRVMLVALAGERRNHKS